MEAAAATLQMVVWGTVCAGLCIALIYRFLKTFVFSV
jgi:hypothetical protein